MPKFNEVAENDKLVKRLNKINQSVTSRLNLAELITEMKNMLLTRKYRHFNHSIFEGAQNKLGDWAGEVATHKARLADIRFMLINDKMRIEELVSTTQKHLMSAYSDQLKKSTTVNAKKAAIDSMLEEPLLTVKKLDRLLKLSDEVYRELDSSYYNSVFIKNVIDITNKRERV